MKLPSDAQKFRSVDLSEILGRLSTIPPQLKRLMRHYLPLSF